MNMVFIVFLQLRGTRRNCFAAVTLESSLFARTRIENLTKVWDNTKILVPLDGKVFDERLKKGRKCPYLCHGSFISMRIS